jgi:hypothetical protein
MRLHPNSDQSAGVEIQKEGQSRNPMKWDSPGAGLDHANHSGVPNSKGLSNVGAGNIFFLSSRSYQRF